MTMNVEICKKKRKLEAKWWSQMLFIQKLKIFVMAILAILGHFGPFGDCLCAVKFKNAQNMAY